MVSDVLHIIWRLWIERNQRLFQDKVDNMASLIHIVAEVNFCYTLTIGVSNSSMMDFKIAHLFHIPLRSKPVVSPLEVRWSPPYIGWVKTNRDGSVFG